MLHQHHLLVGKFAFPPLSRRLTAYQASILLRTAYAVLFHYTIPHSHGQPLLRKVFLMDGAAGALSSPRAGDRASGGLRPSSGLPTQTTADCRTMTRSPGAVTIYPLARACPRRAVNSSRPPIRNPLKTQQAHGRALRAASFSRALRARCARTRSVRAFLFRYIFL